MKMLLPVIFISVLLIMTATISQTVEAQIKIDPRPDPGKNDSEKITDIDKETKDIKSIVDLIRKDTSVEFSVGATEYFPGADGRIFAKVREDATPTSDSHCDVQIFYPNLTVWDSFELPYVPLSRGVYSENFTVPTIEGIYIVDVECVKPLNETSQDHYLRSAVAGGVASDSFFGNSTGTGLLRKDIEDLQPENG